MTSSRAPNTSLDRTISKIRMPSPDGLPLGPTYHNALSHAKPTSQLNENGATCRRSVDTHEAASDDISL